MGSVDTLKQPQMTLKLKREIHRIACVVISMVAVRPRGSLIRDSFKCSNNIFVERYLELLLNIFLFYRNQDTLDYLMEFDMRY